MAYRRIWMFVEGEDDKRFCAAVLEPLICQEFDDIEYWPYAQQKVEKTTGMLRSILKMGADYIFLADVNSMPCVTAKKNTLCERYGKTLDPDRIVVVVKEIEGWFLAGLDEDTADHLGLQVPVHTNDVTKEDFNARIPQRYDSRIDFVAELLRTFSLQCALKRNQSFAYMIRKLNEMGCATLWTEGA